jgi:hypothetical protein
LPAVEADVLPALTEAWQRAATERVEIACTGGRGRTGTALACLAILDGVPNSTAVAFVREHYDPHAVETPQQRRYVARWGGAASLRAALDSDNLKLTIGPPHLILGPDSASTRPPQKPASPRQGKRLIAGRAGG